MPIITISRGSYSHGRDVAERVAREMGYECVSREILLEASEEFNIPEIKLDHALHDAPSVLERFTFGKQRYVAFIKTAFLEHMKNDNVVYHGLAGHAFLTGVAHVLKVRVIADLEERISEAMARDKVSYEQARYRLVKDDDERRRWSIYLHGVDKRDPQNYDLCIRLRKLTIDDAVKVIVDTAGLPCFKTTPESQQALDDLLLAARVEARLVGAFGRARTTSEKGKVLIEVSAPLVQTDAVVKKATELAEQVEGIKEVRVHVSPSDLA
jgi:cytidylate kinase